MSRVWSDFQEGRNERLMGEGLGNLTRSHFCFLGHKHWLPTSLWPHNFLQRTICMCLTEIPGRSFPPSPQLLLRPPEDLRTSLGNQRVEMGSI